VMSRRGEVEIGACFLFGGKWLGVGEIVTYVTISGENCWACFRWLAPRTPWQPWMPYPAAGWKMGSINDKRNGGEPFQSAS